ncbi:hypothetical protein ACFLTH_15305 [Bacteroidota bacterium]
MEGFETFAPTNLGGNALPKIQSVIDKTFYMLDKAGYGSLHMAYKGGWSKISYLPTDDFRIGRIGIGLANTTAIAYDIHLKDGGQFGVTSYTTGWSGAGFLMDYNNTYSSSSYLELDDLLVRGSIRAREFIVEQVRYDAGNRIQGPGAAKVGSVTSATVFNADDPTGNGGTSIHQNDLIMCQKVDLGGATYDGNGDVTADSYLVKRLIYKVTSVSGTAITVDEDRSGALTGAPANSGSIEMGDEFVVFGNTSDSDRQASIEYSVINKYPPQIVMRSGVTSWATYIAAANKKIIIGNLNGHTDADIGALSGYSVFAEDGYFKGTVYGSSMIAGAFKSSATMTYARGIAGTEEGYWFGVLSASEYRLFVGSNASNYLAYDGNDVTIAGGDVIAGAVKSSSTMTYARGVAGTEFGYFLGNESGSKLFIGSSATKKFTYDGTDLSLLGGTITGGVIQTSTDTPKIILNESSSNSLRFYNGTSGYVELVPDYDNSNPSLTINTGNYVNIEDNSTDSYVHLNTSSGATQRSGMWTENTNNDFFICGAAAQTGDSFHGYITYGNGGSSATIELTQGAGAGTVKFPEVVNAVMGYQVNGTGIIDSSRNLTNIANLGYSAGGGSNKFVATTPGGSVTTELDYINLEVEGTTYKLLVTA